jgi:hypothetical protein
MPPPIEPRGGLSRRGVLALSGLVLVFAALWAWPHIQVILDETSPPRIAARAIRKSLLEFADTVGPVEVSGTELRLLEGKLRLVVSVPRQAAQGDAMGHFHVLAHAADTPAASLDACLLGVGDSPEERLEMVVHSFVGLALPPVLSRVKGEPVLGARIFWGEEAWGVPGRHGYVSAVQGRGSADPDSFADAPLFTEIPQLPQDGKLHLLKAVLYGRDGFWVRTVELDGAESGVTERRFAPLDPKAEPGGIVRYAVFDRPSRPAVAGGRQQALDRLKAREAWLFPAAECPADVVPAKLPEFSFSLTTCQGERLLDCLAECQRGAASFCYMAALETEAGSGDPDAARALFVRSCRLGYASGCTNAAAGRLAKHSMDPCSLRTFEQICERAGDPWACTMFGGALAQGEGTSRDPAHARTVLAKACAGAQEDPACVAAQAILSKLPASPVARATR